MEQDKKIDVTNAMKKHGGSFVKALAETMLKADPINLKKIESAFPEIILEYSKKL